MTICIIHGARNSARHIRAIVFTKFFERHKISAREFRAKAKSNYANPRGPRNKVILEWAVQVTLV